jgi:4-amino-4-deoxy-L-arabinose transferase-like glycosyltransferase
VPDFCSDEELTSTAPGSLTVERTSFRVLLAAVALALLAVAVRIPGIGEPPFEFHPTRQYRSLILARSYALADDNISPAAIAAREAARGNRVLEPPLVELATAAAYRLIGKEHLWVGRVVSLASWVVAGFFVLLLGRRFGGDFGGITAMAVFLLNPFAVVASRSFQPDPSMVCLVMVALWWTWRYEEKPSDLALVAAGMSAGMAALLKPTAWFFTVIPFFALVFSDQRASVRQRTTALSKFTAFAFAVPLLYYLPAALFGSSLAEQAQGSLSVKPIATAAFWRGWVSLLERLPGFVTLIAGLVGLVVSPPGRIRLFLAALWCGYPILGFVFNYHIHTHDYYGLPFLIAVSLSISIVAGRITAIAQQVWRDRTGTLLLTGILALAVLLSAGGVIARVTAIGDLPIVNEWRLAGEAVGHSSRTVFLARWYGKPLQYHGILAGTKWPVQEEFDLEAKSGAPILDAEHRLLQRVMEGAEFFVITDRVEFDKQEDLARILSHFPVVAAGEELLVFDLRGTRPANAQPSSGTSVPSRHSPQELRNRGTVN